MLSHEVLSSTLVCAMTFNPQAAIGPKHVVQLDFVSHSVCDV